MVFHFNDPVRTREHRILESLDIRLGLPRENTRQLARLRKGHEGEMRFRDFLKADLRSDCVVLYDLSFESNDSAFQIDCLIVQQREIWHLEVKNFEGDYKLQDNSFYSYALDKRVQNPVGQLERGNVLLNQVLQANGYQFPVKSRVVFVNPRFMLFQCDRPSNIIHPPQLPQFISSLNHNPSQLTSAHFKMVRKLMSALKRESDSSELPAYTFSGLAKGIRCLECRGFLGVSGKRLVCDGCGFSESRESGVMRNIAEFDLLFPGEKITTRRMAEWCGGVVNMYALRTILTRFMFPVGRSRHIHYVFTDKGT